MRPSMLRGRTTPIGPFACKRTHGWVVTHFEIDCCMTASQSSLRHRTCARKGELGAMETIAEYRAKAAEFTAIAEHCQFPDIARQYLDLAREFAFIALLSDGSELSPPAPL